VEQLNARMVSALAEGGARIDAVLYCPHAPEQGCACRKPRPGLLMEAGRRLGVSPSDTCVVGDWVDDIVAAREAECAVPILVLTGRGRRALPLARAAGVSPFLVARDLLSAAQAIVSWGDGDGARTPAPAEELTPSGRYAQ
jgi:D-glycero-D-manno-heptose 1,7-bisphosphate phosphatase